MGKRDNTYPEVLRLPYGQRVIITSDTNGHRLPVGTTGTVLPWTTPSGCPGDDAFWEGCQSQSVLLDADHQALPVRRTDMEPIEEREVHCPECGRRALIPHSWDYRCVCRATLSLCGDDVNGRPWFVLERTFRAGKGKGSRMWQMHYDSVCDQTVFRPGRRGSWNGEFHNLGSFVSHNRFVKLLPFL